MRLNVIALGNTQPFGPSTSETDHYSKEDSLEDQLPAHPENQKRPRQTHAKNKIPDSMLWTLHNATRKKEEKKIRARKPCQNNSYHSRLLLAETSRFVVSHIQSSGFPRWCSLESGVWTIVSSEEYDASMGVSGAVMLFVLLGEGPLTSLLDLLIEAWGCSLPVMTAALGKGCSIQETSSRSVILRVVGGWRSLTAGWRAWW
jgi:hypothetical protein